jgi:anti-sigma regulatory factor (Ser/Thr protein kinase)
MFCSEALPKSAASAAIVRRMLDQFRAEVPADTLADARLLASELVANAVQHTSGDSDIAVRIDSRDRVLRVEVLDSGTGFTPRPRTRESPEGSGWGLHFIDRLASRWAVDRQDRGRVWFELDLRD